MGKKIKLISLMITAVIMVLSFSACGDNSAEEVKNTAEAFCSDFDKFKFKDAAQYLDEIDDSSELAEINGTKDLENMMMENMNINKETMEQSGMSEDVINKFAKKLVKMLSVKHNINAVEKKDNNTYEVKVEFSMSAPDFDIDFSSDKYEKEVEDYLINECGLSDSSTQEEAMKYVPKAVEHVFDIMLEDLEDSVEEESKDATLVFVNNNGKWLISASKSEIGSSSIEDKYDDSDGLFE